VAAAFRYFVPLSVVLHVGAVALVAVQPASEPHALPPPDRFVGSGIEIDAVTLPSTVSEPAPPAAQANPPSEPTTTAAPATTAPATTAPAAPAPTTTAPATTAPAVPGPVAVARPRSPRRATPVVTRPATAASSTNGASSATPAADSTPTTTSGSFGASGLPPGVRHLPNAFTRALAIANRGDARWRNLPLGRAGEAHLRIPVTDEGALGELEFANTRERDELLPVVRHLLDNTLLLLKNGRFSLDARKERPGVAKLRVVVEIGERSGIDSEGDPGELFGVAWEAPSGAKPGKSGFILNSGRQVTAWVWVE
jgi:hypothetical protein